MNERGVATTVQENSEKRPIKVIAAEGSNESFQYNINGMLTDYINAAGNITTLQNNDQNKLIQTILAKGKPEQRIVLWEYDQYSQATSIKIGEKQQIKQ
ncbi:hypothetical protein [Snodgrassella gandavensis]|uniref:hypothetical protein n=1 Tax=Snodgrassella gandavensis TaxID=2946698 RepID=UPI001EF60FB5|nr:hypothetical protein [Snodgrassella gandavensis]